MRKLLTLAMALSATGFLAAATVEKAKARLTLCWAAWDPANALVELSKDFTAETGIEMKFEFVPWTNYADRFLNELNSQGKLCDLIIGDSQWIGGSAENGHYIKLNDFFAKEGISMDDFLPATVYAYSTWPKGTPNYWALPAMGDALGWVYRKDWFAKPEIQAEFKTKYGRDLAPPKTWTELKQVAEFFQGREIDGKKVYGAAIFTERGSEGITMGVTAALYAWGFKYENPDKPYEMEGFVNSPDAVAALEFYKELYKCCTPPGYSDAYMQEGLDAFKSGQVAMMMNWFAFWPGMYKDENVGGDKIGFFVNPGEKVAGLDARRPGHLGGLLLRRTRTTRSSTSSGSRSPRCRRSGRRWAARRPPRPCCSTPDYPAVAPFAADFLIAMGQVQDFWQEPAYAELLQAMQKRVHDYVVADQGTAQEALDLLVEDWTETFESEGKM